MNIEGENLGFPLWNNSASRTAARAKRGAEGRETYNAALRPELYSGGAEGARTPDLMHAMHALYQLSYSPTEVWELI